MFERFHEDARQAVVVARREAAMMGQREIGCSHLLLGIMSEPDGPGALALSAAGIDLDAVRRATEASFGQGALERAAAPRREFGAMRLTRPAKKSLEFALRAAARMHSGHISSGHLLLGLIDQADNGAVAALTAAGVDTAALRADVMSRLVAAA